jgi:hypothetical protein
LKRLVGFPNAGTAEVLKLDSFSFSRFEEKESEERGKRTIETTLLSPNREKEERERLERLTAREKENEERE